MKGELCNWASEVELRVGVYSRQCRSTWTTTFRNVCYDTSKRGRGVCSVQRAEFWSKWGGGRGDVYWRKYTTFDWTNVETFRYKKHRTTSHWLGTAPHITAVRPLLGAAGQRTWRPSRHVLRLQRLQTPSKPKRRQAGNQRTRYSHTSSGLIATQRIQLRAQNVQPLYGALWTSSLKFGDEEAN
jgi:hypothetical protein